MAEILVANLNLKARAKVGGKAGRGGASVKEERIRDAAGQVKILRTLDARSRTFGDDLRYVFGKNVAKARRDNKKAVGSADIAPDKC
jgi:hypothetical protein